MYGKTMSIPDSLLENWFELCTDVPMDEVRALVASAESGETNPRDVKRRLAREIVALYHSREAAEQADAYFLETFSKRNQPVDAPEAAIPADSIHDGAVQLPALMVALELAKSNGDAKQKIRDGAVTLDGEKITQLEPISLDDLVGKVIKVGKHQFRKLTK